MERSRAYAQCGIAGSIVLTVGWIAGGLVQPDSYSASSQEISDLGALTADHPWVWNVADSLSGVLIAIFALGLFRLMGSERPGRIGAVLIGVGGLIGGLLDGIFREDCPLSTSQACQDLRDGPGLSWHHQAHDIESLLLGLFILVAPFLLARAFKRLPDWRSLAPFSLATGVALIAAVGVYVALYAGDGGGIAQRALVSIYLAWIVVLALRARSLSGAPPPPAAPAA